MVPFQFHPVQVFDKTKHVVDLAAKRYLEKAEENDFHHFLPVNVPADGNCLYHSIILLINNSSVTTDELRGMGIYLSSMLLCNLFPINF